jgi:TolB-like protein
MLGPVTVQAETEADDSTESSTASEEAQSPDGASASLANDEAPPDAQDEDPNQRTRVLVLGTTAVNIDESTVTLLNDLITESVSRHAELEVMSASEVKAMANFAADRLAAGCDEDSCLAELAGALDADYVVFGKLGRLDKTLVLTLKLFDAKEQKAVERRTVKGMNRTVVMDQIDGTIEDLISPLIGKSNKKVEEVVEAEDEGLGGLFWTGAALTVIGAGAAGGMGYWANEQEKAAADLSNPNVDERASALENGQYGLVFTGVGAGVALLGVGLMVVGAM